jgi:hypothetical protein
MVLFFFVAFLATVVNLFAAAFFFVAIYPSFFGSVRIVSRFGVSGELAGVFTDRDGAGASRRKTSRPPSLRSSWSGCGGCFGMFGCVIWSILAVFHGLAASTR